MNRLQQNTHAIHKSNFKVYPSKHQLITDQPKVATIKPISGSISNSLGTTDTATLGRVQPIHKHVETQAAVIPSVPPLAALSTSTAAIARNTSNTQLISPHGSGSGVASYIIPTNSWPDVEKQMAELRKQLDELRKQFELSQKQNEEYYGRIEKLEKQLECERRLKQGDFGSS